MHFVWVWRVEVKNVGDDLILETLYRWGWFQVPTSYHHISRDHHIVHRDNTNLTQDEADAVV